MFPTNLLHVFVISVFKTLGIRIRIILIMRLFCMGVKRGLLLFRLVRNERCRHFTRNTVKPRSYNKPGICVKWGRQGMHTEF
jgi:hypothetical protein